MKRRNQGHVGVIQAPLGKNVSVQAFISQYAPRAQKNGNLIVTDAREVQLAPHRFVRFSVTHVSTTGTDASDLQDFAEEAAIRCGYAIPDDLLTLIFVKPIRKKANPHKGSPRPPSQRRRTRRISISGSVGASA